LMARYPRLFIVLFGIEKPINELHIADKLQFFQLMTSVKCQLELNPPLNQKKVYGC
jgi:hypothetical protein